MLVSHDFRLIEQVGGGWWVGGVLGQGLRGGGGAGEAAVWPRPKESPWALGCEAAPSRRPRPPPLTRPAHPPASPPTNLPPPPPQVAKEIWECANKTVKPWRGSIRDYKAMLAKKMGLRK